MTLFRTPIRTSTRITARVLAATAAVVVAVSAWAQPVDGEVRKIDKAQGRVTLAHGEIKSLDMPAMTMVYRVADPAVLDKVAVGDKVRFQAEKVNGQFTVTQLVKN